MPSKSPSPEAAQRKIWAAEIKTHEKAARKVQADFRKENNRLIGIAVAAQFTVEKFQRRTEKQLPKQLQSIDRRIAILKGRLGL